MLKSIDRILCVRIIISGILLPVVIAGPMMILFYLQEKSGPAESRLDNCRNVFCDTSFVRAGKSCLDCHGDPGKSKKLWVAGSNSETIPSRLKDLDEGDLGGKLEAAASNRKAELQVLPQWFIAGIILFGGICIYTICFFSVVIYLLKEHRDRQKAAGCYDWQIYDLEQKDRELLTIMD